MRKENKSSFIYIETKPIEAMQTAFVCVKRIMQKWNYWFLPLKKEQIFNEFNQNIQGMKVRLPFTAKELDVFSKEEVKSLMFRIIRKQSTQNILVEKKLEPFFEDIDIIDGCIIPYFFIREMLEVIRKKHKLLLKDIHVVILDSGFKDTEYVVECLYRNVNFLSVITEREEYFSEMQDDIYAETGLPVQVCSYQTFGVKINGQEKIKPSIVFDLSMSEAVPFRLLPQKTIYLDFQRNIKKYRLLSAKRKDIVYYNQVSLSAQRDEGHGYYSSLMLQQCLLPYPTMKIKESFEEFFLTEELPSTQIKDVITVI